VRGVSGALEPLKRRGWSFHHVSHRIQSERRLAKMRSPWKPTPRSIAWLRSLAYCLQLFEQHSLMDKSIVMWANQMADGDVDIVIGTDEAGGLPEHLS